MKRITKAPLSQLVRCLCSLATASIVLMGLDTSFASTLITPGQTVDLASLGFVPNSYLGSAVAMEKDTAVIVGLKPGGFGLVWTYQRTGASWRLGTQLEATGVVNTQGFGYGVALSGDTIAVLSRPATTVTAVTLFVRAAGVWRLQQTITSATWPISGVTSIALHGDTLCLGTPLGTPAKSLILSGYVDVFTRNGDMWGYQKTLSPPDPQRGERFGIAMAFDSGRLIVGAPYATVGKGVYCGACYAYAPTSAGLTQTAKIIDPTGGGRSYLFGSSVALSGKCLLVSSPGRGQMVGSPTRPYNTLKGTISAFALNAAGVWQSEGLLPPPMHDPNPAIIAAPQFLGQKIALSGCLAVVSNTTTVAATDRSYVYQRRGAHWVQLAPLVDNHFDVSEWDPQTYDPLNPPLFNLLSSPGGVPAVSGSTMMIGAPNESTGAGVRSGSVRFYNYVGTALAAFDGSSFAATELPPTAVNGPVPVVMNDIVLERVIKRSFTLQNIGVTPLSNLTFTTDNPDVVITATPVPVLDPLGTATVTLTITPSAEGPWEANVVAVTAAGRAGPSLTLNLQSNVVVYPSPAAITADPASAVLRAGVNYEISAEVSGSEPIAYQWYKDGKPCKGCTKRVMSFSPVTIADRGIYELLVTSEGGSAFSGQADISVYQMQTAAVGLRKNEGDTITMSVPIGLSSTSRAITVNWYLNGVLVKDDLRNFTIKGAKTPNLTVSKLNAATAGKYTAVVNPGDQNVTVGTWSVVVTLRPVIQGNYSRPLTMSVVSPLTMHFTTAPAAASFAFKGLPPGVIANTKTGTLAGRPTIPGNYTITVAGTNGAGTGTPTSVALAVQPLDSRAVGTYYGFIGRDSGNGGLGGKVTLTTTATGLCSGSGTAGTRTTRFTGAMQFKPDGSPYRATFIGVSAGVTDYYTLDIDPATGRLTGQLASSNSSTNASITGWSNPWSAARPALQWSDYITVALNPPSSLVPAQTAIPFGTSFGTATINSTGVVSWAGRMSDGSVTTATTVISGTQTAIGSVDHVEMPINFALNAGKGSAQGMLWLSQSNAVQAGYHSVTNSLDWFKQAGPGRSFAAGIPLHTLTAEGGRYEAPQPGYLILNLPVEIANAQLAYSGGDIESAYQYQLVSQPFTITLGGRADFAQPDYVSNRFVFSAAKGTFSGTVTLSDPSASNAAVFLRRTLNSYGVLLKAKGAGFFSLPGVPNPASTPPTSALTSPIGSGRVLLGRPAVN